MWSNVTGSCDALSVPNRNNLPSDISGNTGLDWTTPTLDNVMSKNHRVGPLFVIPALFAMLVITACSSSDPTPVPTAVPTSTPQPTPTPIPPFAETRPVDLPGWIPDELWNRPVVDGFVRQEKNPFSHWDPREDSDGIFMLPDDLQPGSPAAEFDPQCQMPTTAFPNHLVQAADLGLEHIELSDPNWTDFISPTGYEYYECIFDVTGPIPAGLITETGSEEGTVDVPLTGQLPEFPVRVHGLTPSGPCQFGIEWEGFESIFVRGGAELLPSGIIKLSCLYQNVPS